MRWFMTAWLGILLCWPAMVSADASPKRAQSTKQPLPPLGRGSVFAFLPSASARKRAGAIKTDAIVRAIAEHLRTHGFRVLPPAQVRAQLTSHALESCKDPTTCDPALALATLRADAVISTAIWRRPSAPAQLVVHVRRQQGYGQAEINVRGSTTKELRAAAVKALEQALEDSQQTHEIDVVIESQPIGATVHVDQTLKATTPAHFALLPGSHLVSVEAAGFVTRAQYLELPERGMRETRLELKLSKDEADADGPRAEPAPAPKPHKASPPVKLSIGQDPLPSPQVQPLHPEVRDQTNSTNYVVAAVLFGIAAPLVANAIYGAATNGQCVGQLDSQGNCSERVGLGPFFYLSAGLGGLAVLGGSTFLFFQPLQSNDYALTGAQLQVAQHF